MTMAKRLKGKSIGMNIIQYIGQSGSMPDTISFTT